MKTIVLTGGGTLGHVIPNIALIPELKKYFDKIIYIGSGSKLEKEYVEKYKLPYYAINCTKLIRKFTLKNLAIPFKYLKSINEAKRLLATLSPDIIFSKGGFVALPIVKAGKKLSIPVIAHESDLNIGLANKLCKKQAKVICTSFHNTAMKLKNGVHTGSPIRQDIIEIKNKIKDIKLEKQKLFNNKLPILLVLGGSQGASFFNETIINNIEKFAKQFNIILITGNKKSDEISKKIKNIENNSEKTLKNCIFFDFCPNLEKYLYLADVVLTRGGSNALFEIAYLNKPMVVIPLPKKQSRGDQIDNAKYFEKYGMAKCLLQENATADNIIKHLHKTLKSKINTNFINPHANSKIVEIIISNYFKI